MNTFTWKSLVLYAIGFILFIFLGIYIMWYLQKLYPMTFLDVSLTTVILGGVTSAVGLFFTIWANYFLITKGNGLPGNFGKLKIMPETKHLVTTGPYAICRNPMHLGLFLYYMGFACAINSLSSLIVPVLFIIFAYCFAILLDEPRLKKDFPEEFSVYKEQVPRFMPKILSWKRG